VHQPEIYTKFLEILQTYQLESKPIQDVHSQVTQLFWNAPDLLDDFMQFLSQRVAKARAAAAGAANGMGGMSDASPIAVRSSTISAAESFRPPPSVVKEKGKYRVGQVPTPPIRQKVENIFDVGGDVNKVGTRIILWVVTVMTLLPPLWCVSHADTFPAGADGFSAGNGYCGIA
jgi:hypothetical protein